MPSTLALVLLLVLLLIIPSVHGGVTTETVSGTYVPYPLGTEIGRQRCPTVVKVGELETNSTSALSTSDEFCDDVRMQLKEVIRNENSRLANGSVVNPGNSMTSKLLRYDFEKTGVIVTGNIKRRLSCDRNSRRNQIGKRHLLTFFRPRVDMTEFQTEFRAREFYLAFPKGNGRFQCIYSRKSQSIIPDAKPGPSPVTPSSNPIPGVTEPQNSENSSLSGLPHETTRNNAEQGISIWAWLGPLIGAAVLLIALLTAFCVRSRRDRWYPFAGQHEDISDADFFGRISQQVDKNPSDERPPSGVVFERVDTSEHDRPSSGEFGPHHSRP